MGGRAEYHSPLRSSKQGVSGSGGSCSSTTLAPVTPWKPYKAHCWFQYQKCVVLLVIACPHSQPPSHTFWVALVAGQNVCWPLSLPLPQCIYFVHQAELQRALSLKASMSAEGHSPWELW